MEILWEEEGFQFGFKRWQGWAVSKVLWEWIPNVGSKARESAEAMSLAFVLLDFQHAGVRRMLILIRQAANMHNLSGLVRLCCLCPRMSVDILGTSWDQCRSMVQYSFTSTETRRLVRTDSPGRPPRLSHSSWTMFQDLVNKSVYHRRVVSVAGSLRYWRKPRCRQAEVGKEGD